MIRVSAPARSGRAHEAQVVLLFEDVGGVGAGIRDVEVFDVGGTPIPVAQPAPGSCPNTWTVVTPWLARSRFPLFAEAADCRNNRTEWQENGPLAQELAAPGAPTDPGLPVPPECVPTDLPPEESARCMEEQARLNAAAEAMRPGCEECERIRRRAEERSQTANEAWIAHVVASALAILAFATLPWPANVIVGAVFATAAAIAGIVAAWAQAEAESLWREHRSCLGRLFALREAYNNALAEAERWCCSFTIPPAC